MSDTKYKIPQSVLVVIYTPALEVLLIERVDAKDFWQSVTGSKEDLEEDFCDTAVREVAEETGIRCGSGTELSQNLRDWHLENVYEIYPRWRHRYAPGVLRNTEHLFGLCVPRAIPITLNPSEHTAYCWRPYPEAAQLCFSPSNAEACLLLPRLAELRLAS